LGRVGSAGVGAVGTLSGNEGSVVAMLVVVWGFCVLVLMLLLKARFAELRQEFRSTSKCRSSLTVFIQFTRLAVGTGENVDVGFLKGSEAALYVYSYLGNLAARHFGVPTHSLCFLDDKAMSQPDCLSSVPRRAETRDFPWTCHQPYIQVQVEGASYNSDFSFLEASLSRAAEMRLRCIVIRKSVRALSSVEPRLVA
jgi:hypothetical protein